MKRALLLSGLGLNCCALGVPWGLVTRATTTLGAQLQYGMEFRFGFDEAGNYGWGPEWGLDYKLTPQVIPEFAPVFGYAHSARVAIALVALVALGVLLRPARLSVTTLRTLLGAACLIAVLSARTVISPNPLAAALVIGGAACVGIASGALASRSKGVTSS